MLFPLYGQSPAASDLDGVGERLVSFFRKERPDWEHNTVEPGPLPAPGSQPNRNVAVHFWRSDKCLMVSAVIDGKMQEGLPVYCTVKVAVYQFPSAEAARAYLGGFAERERPRKAPWTLRPLALGDEGYGWRMSNVVFRRGRFVYWLDSSVGNSYGRDQFELEKEATEAFAKDVARAAPAT
jgi:hypothetical protein